MKPIDDSEKNRDMHLNLEEQLKKQNNLLNNIIESLTHPFYVIDTKDYTIKLANSALQHTTNKGAATCYALTHQRDRPCDDAEHPCTIKKIKETKEAVTLEHIHYDKDGHPRLVEVHGYPIFDSEGNIAQVIEYNIDITERKKAEEALHNSEKKFRSLFNQATDSIMLLSMTDEGAVISDCNEATLSAHGYTREELIGKPITFLDDPVDAEKVPERIQELRDKGSSSFEVTHVRKDGTKFPVEVNAQIIKIAETPFVLTIDRDITARKKVEKELSKGLQLSQFQAAIGIALSGPEELRVMLNSCAQSLVDTFNGAFARIWTLNDKEQILELQASAGLYTHLDGPHSRIPVGKFKIGRIAHERMPHLTNHVIGDACVSNQEWAQHEGMVAFAGYPLLVRDRIVGVMAMFARHPLTEQDMQAMGTVANNLALAIENKQAEEEKDRLLSELAEKKSELQEVIHVTSHDLRSPLVNIIGYHKEIKYSLRELNEFLKEVDIPQESREKIRSIIDKDIPDAVKFIDASVTKMESLFSGLLSLSRSGRAELQIEKLDMNRLTADVLSTLEFQFKKQGARHERSELPACSGDEKLIDQVFSNLISNALKYLDPERPGVIKISGYKEDGNVVYCVEDNGIGIPSEEENKIFEIFHQINPKSAGEGLGLNIVKKIVERHNGRYGWSQRSGKGVNSF